MATIAFNREKAKEVSRIETLPFWNPSEKAQALVEVLDEPRTINKTRRMKRDAWVVDVHIIAGKDIDEAENGEKVEVDLTNEKRSLVLNSKTVVESKFKRLIEQYKTLKGMRLVLLGLGEVQGDSSRYIDFYLDTEEKAREEGVIA